MKIQRAIYKSYASLASAIQQNLKDRIYQAHSNEELKARHDADTYFEDLQQFMDPLYNKTVFSTQYRLSHLKKSGGHLPADLAKLLGTEDEESLKHG